jgi:hypothetical protein
MLLTSKRRSVRFYFLHAGTADATWMALVPTSVLATVPVSVTTPSGGHANLLLIGQRCLDLAGDRVIGGGAAWRRRPLRLPAGHRQPVVPTAGGNHQAGDQLVGHHGLLPFSVEGTYLFANRVPGI